MDDYDFDNESDVMEVVERFLPMPKGGQIHGARAAVRSIAVTQVLNDDPPATWRAVVRMRDAGLDRDEVLRQLTMVISESVIEALSESGPAKNARLVAAIDALPLPTPKAIAEALVAVVRETPGIAAEHHIERAIATLGLERGGRVVETMVERVLDHVIEGPLHWLADDATVVFLGELGPTPRDIDVLVVGTPDDYAVTSVCLDLSGQYGVEVSRMIVGRDEFATRGRNPILDQITSGPLVEVASGHNHLLVI